MGSQYTWMPSGFSASLTGGGVSGTWIKSDASICQGFVDYVADKRFVIDDIRNEVSDHVLASVRKVREYSVQSMHLLRSETARQSMKRIADACRDYVRGATPIADHETLGVALLALRKRIGSELVALVTKYSLDCDLDLTPYTEDGVEVGTAARMGDSF
ncbi:MULTISPECIES: hypothetical protein [unclassified Microbacterium]|uniref:hypothetical protein n=1 Tax=unclassified Microbacterium TaxID=2609290 RepID=UPI003017E970